MPFVIYLVKIMVSEDCCMMKTKVMTYVGSNGRHFAIINIFSCYQTCLQRQSLGHNRDCDIVIATRQLQNRFFDGDRIFYFCVRGILYE